MTEELKKEVVYWKEQCQANFEKCRALRWAVEELLAGDPRPEMVKDSLNRQMQDIDIRIKNERENE